MREKEKATVPQPSFRAGGVTYWLPEQPSLLKVEAGMLHGAVTYYGVCSFQDADSDDLRYYREWEARPAAVITIDEDVSAFLLEWMLCDLETASAAYRNRSERGCFEHWDSNLYSLEMLDAFLAKVKQASMELENEPQRFFKERFPNAHDLFYLLELQTGSFEDSVRLRREVPKGQQYDVLVRHAPIVQAFYQQFYGEMKKIMQDYPDADTFAVSGP